MRSRTLLAAASLAASAGSTLAQCDYYTWFAPDFDQRRHATATQIGLPDDGNMYCAPTSVSNWLAYFANAGAPIFAGPGFRDWQSNANYDLATNFIGGVGAAMGTDPVNGTSGLGEYNGMVAYLDALAPGLFSVALAWSTPTSIISPANFAYNNAGGGYVQASYGRFIDDGGGYFTYSGGGHCITITGVANACANSATVYFRDPADDPANTSQSPFITRNFTANSVLANFRDNPAQSYEVRPAWQIVGANSPCFLDSMLVIYPSFYISNGSPGMLTFYHPFVPWKPVQQIGSIPIPGSSPVIQDVGLPPCMNTYYAAVAPTSSGTPSHIYRYDPAAAAMVPILTGTNFKRLAFSRFGELYAADGPVLTRYIPDPLPPVAMGTITPTLPVESMDYDDLADELVTLSTASGRRVQRFSRSLGMQTATQNLPTSTMLMGTTSLAVSPLDGALWVCADMTDVIYKLTWAGGSTPLMQALSIPLPPGSHPTGLNVRHDGHLIFSSNGVLKEMEYNSSGWVNSPSSLYAGRAAGPNVALTRHRSACIAGIHDAPGYLTLAAPESFPGTPDCYANCDRSTTPPALNVLDFSCFLNRFASGDSYANCDNSTAPPVINVLDFSCFLNRFAAGCP